MALDPELRRIILAHQTRTEALRARIVRFIERTWGSLRSWRDDDIDRFVAAVLPTVEGGQRLTANLTDAYLAAIEAATFDTPVRPRGVNPDTVTTEALRGIPAAELWHRVGVTVWTALSRGVPLDQAVAQGERRALDLAVTGLQLAKTHTSQAILSNDPRVTGYRRVLEGRGSCGLCVAVSTRRYHREDLMPIHPGCDCSVAPIYEDADPGGRLVADLSQLVVTHEHGEIGPVLAVRGQHFTGPSDI
jgi:hypothetical protein